MFSEEAENSTGCAKLVELLLQARTPILSNPGNGKDHRGQGTDFIKDNKDNNYEFVAALPKIFKTPEKLFWVREEGTTSEAELAVYPTDKEETRDLLVLKRIAFGGVRDKLKPLENVFVVL